MKTELERQNTRLPVRLMIGCLTVVTLFAAPLSNAVQNDLLHVGVNRYDDLTSTRIFDPDGRGQFEVDIDESDKSIVFSILLQGRLRNDLIRILEIVDPMGMKLYDVTAADELDLPLSGQKFVGRGELALHLPISQEYPLVPGAYKIRAARQGGRALNNAIALRKKNTVPEDAAQSVDVYVLVATMAKKLRSVAALKRMRNSVQRAMEDEFESHDLNVGSIVTRMAKREEMRSFGNLRLDNQLRQLKTACGTVGRNSRFARAIHVVIVNRVQIRRGGRWVDVNGVIGGQGSPLLSGSKTTCVVVSANTALKNDKKPFVNWILSAVPNRHFGEDRHVTSERAWQLSRSPLFYGASKPSPLLHPAKRKILRGLIKINGERLRIEKVDFFVEEDRDFFELFLAGSDKPTGLLALDFENRTGVGEIAYEGVVYQSRRLRVRIRNTRNDLIVTGQWTSENGNNRQQITIATNEAQVFAGTSELKIVDDRAELSGVLGARTYNQIIDLVANYPEVTTLVLRDSPGSIDDDINVETGRLIRNAGMNTLVPADGEIASGAVDLFLSGVKRTVEPGAKLGIHSWAGDGVTGEDLPRADRRHDSLIAFSREMLGPIGEGFYFHTLRAAPADEIHIMASEEIERWLGVTP